MKKDNNKFINLMQSITPSYVGSPGAFLIACNLVLITSKGLTNNAAVDPATQPARNEHQNTAEKEQNN